MIKPIKNKFHEILQYFVLDIKNSKISKNYKILSLRILIVIACEKNLQNLDEIKIDENYF